MRRAVVLALLLPLAPRPELSAATQAAGDMRIALHPYFRDLRTVRATVGADTLTLLLDTGGGATALTPARAARAGCQPRGRDIGYRMTGERVEFQRCPGLQLSLGAFATRLAPMGIFDLAALLPPELPPLDGVLALDAFRGRVITLDLAQNLLIVHGPRSSARAVAANGVPLRFATGQSGRFLEAFVRIEGESGPLWFLLDSGNLLGTIVSEEVVREGQLAVTTDQRSTLRVGDRVRFETSVTPKALVIDGALGTDFLRRGPVTLDLRRAPRAE
ncbi:MAG: hypothetical protein U0164_24690 [Gemmatimonadaceae bacterium]